MLTPTPIQKVAIAVASGVLIPIIAGYYLGIGAAWVALGICIALIILFDGRVREHTAKWSGLILQKGEKRPMLYFWLFAGTGAVLGFALMGGGFLYQLHKHRKTPVKELSAAESFALAMGEKDVRGAGPTVEPTERARRLQVLERLRNEYILSHDGVSAAMLAGTEPLPDDWVNKRLAELGETWRVGIERSSEDSPKRGPKTETARTIEPRGEGPDVARRGGGPATSTPPKRPSSRIRRGTDDPFIEFNDKELADWGRSLVQRIEEVIQLKRDRDKRLFQQMTFPKDNEFYEKEKGSNNKWLYLDFMKCCYDDAVAFREEAAKRLGGMTENRLYDLFALAKDKGEDHWSGAGFDVTLVPPDLNDLIQRLSKKADLSN